MDYDQTIDFLFNQLPVFQVQGPGAYKPGLQTAWTLTEAFGAPHKAFKTIHVAGTNGKGSTSHMLASILGEAGYKVGLYTSPHIHDFRERIRVDGDMITREDVVDFVDRYRAMDLDCQPSFFELTTIMAFDYFRSQNVDIAVIETGLGGRLDTTNIITPLVSIITNVSLDHMALLGDTEVKIAGEKAGIIKPSVPAVVGEAEGEVREVFEEYATQVGTDIYFAEDFPYRYVLQPDRSYAFSLGTDGVYDAVCDLIGEFQAKNINTVLTALDVLGFSDKDAIRRGLANVQLNTGLFGRWTQVHRDGRDVVFDTGHNIGAWQYLAPRLQAIADTRPLRVVLGFSNDKDISRIFDMLPAQARYYFVKPSVQRGRPADDLLKMAQDRGLAARAFATVREGYDRALAESASDALIFVGGSNFVVADL